jgi:hypothetical protein
MSLLVTDVIDASKTMSDKEKLKLAAELADAADVIQRSVRCEHPEMFDMHTKLDAISDDLFELSGK